MHGKPFYARNDEYAVSICKRIFIISSSKLEVEFYPVSETGERRHRFLPNRQRITFPA